MCHCKNVLNQEEEAGSGKRKNGPMWQLWNCENGQQSTVPRLQSPVPSPQTFDFRPLTLDFRLQKKTIITRPTLQIFKFSNFRIRISQILKLGFLKFSNQEFSNYDFCSVGKFTRKTFSEARVRAVYIQRQKSLFICSSLT